MGVNHYSSRDGEDYSINSRRKGTAAIYLACDFSERQNFTIGLGKYEKLENIEIKREKTRRENCGPLVEKLIYRDISILSQIRC